MTPVDEPGAFHRDAFVFDGHNDMALRVLDGADPAEPAGTGHMDLPRMREGGLDGGIFAVWIDPACDDPLERTLDGVRRFRDALEAAPGFRPVLAPGDLSAAVEAGEVAALVGVEGGYGVEEDLEAVDRIHGAGARCFTLTWMEPTAWADAAGAPPRHGGLTDFGGRVVDRLQERGVLVDVSHASDETTGQVLARAERPVAASHSGCRAVAGHPRNLPDRLLEELAENGGLVGVNFFPGYLDAERGRRFDRLRREGVDLFSPDGRSAMEEATRDLPPVGLERIAEHAEHAARVAGPEAVGLGSDFDGVPSLPDGLEDVSDLPRLTGVLADRGMGPEDLRGVLGESFRRVVSEALA